MSKKSYARKNISKKIRFEVFKRDSFTCQYCGDSAPKTVLEVDHIMPVSKGGDNSLLNLITSCFNCNRGKSNKSLNDDSLVTKQNLQAKLLQERKSQIEMMAKWQMSLLDIENDVANNFNGYWHQLTGYTLTDNGLKNAKNYINKHGYKKVCEYARKSYERYSDDIEITFNSIPKLIAYDEIPESIRSAYYLRGVLKNRLYYVDNVDSLGLLKELLNLYSYSEIYNLCCNVKNWTQFVNIANEMLED